MRLRLLKTLALAVGLSASAAVAETPFQAANESLFAQLRKAHNLSDGQMQRIRAIFARSGVVGQGNPAISVHPLTPEQCRARGGKPLASAAADARICGGPNMAPLYDPATQWPRDAKVCIDRFEFPDIACALPVVWVKANEAAEICEAMGKRICDAHEWEGACAGSLQPPDYPFDLARGQGASGAVSRMRNASNRANEPSKSWSYGPAYAKGICAANSQKSPGCEGGGWNRCGSNTYPTGSFANCRSALGVYDLNGNAAEHMNLPLTPDQMASAGSRKLGVTEMKGSWFIFDRYNAHPDWCRWRAPYWHGSEVRDRASHANYHLGFRCCKTVN